MNIPIRIGSLLLLMFPSPLFADVVITAQTRIERVVVLDELGVLRVEVSTTALANPANCTSTTAYLDIRLDTPNRSATEQRELLNLINLAFVTNRFVRFYLLDSTEPNPCSTAGGASASLRVAVGLQVLN